MDVPRYRRNAPSCRQGTCRKHTPVAPMVAGPADAREWPSGLAGRDRTRVSDILHHHEGWQGFPGREDLFQQALRTESGAAEISFSFRIQTIRLERLPCIAPGYSHGNALPSCTGSPPVAATVLGPAKPAGFQVFATAAPVEICLIIIQFRESSGNNTTPQGNPHDLLILPFPLRGRVGVGVKSCGSEACGPIEGTPSR